MRIDEKLNLVVPVRRDDGEPGAYAYHSPISREVFEAHFMLLGKTFSAVQTSGLGVVAGPRVASLLLAKAAEQEGDELGAMALMNEIRRLTNAVIRTPKGWESFAFQDVVDGGLLDAEDVAEVTNAIVFFTVISSVQGKKLRKPIMAGAARIWGARTSSSDFTALVASLTTSTAHANTRREEASSPVS